MSDNPHQDRLFELSLSLEEQWTLHHVLLDRIEQEGSVVNSANVEPPPVEVYRAFDRIDAGTTSFTGPQIEAIQGVLSEYHHSTTWWEIERSQLEELLRQVADHLPQNEKGRRTDETEARQQSDARGY